MHLPVKLKLNRSKGIVTERIRQILKDEKCLQKKIIVNLLSFCAKQVTRRPGGRNFCCEANIRAIRNFLQKMGRQLKQIRCLCSMNMMRMLRTIQTSPNFLILGNNSSVRNFDWFKMQQIWSFLRESVMSRGQPGKQASYVNNLRVGALNMVSRVINQLTHNFLITRMKIKIKIE